MKVLRWGELTSPTLDLGVVTEMDEESYKRYCIGLRKGRMWVICIRSCIIGFKGIACFSVLESVYRTSPFQSSYVVTWWLFGCRLNMVFLSWLGVRASFWLPFLTPRTNLEGTGCACLWFLWFWGQGFLFFGVGEFGPLSKPQTRAMSVKCMVYLRPISQWTWRRWRMER